jgi:uncharacterized protein YnzC (UPF0291/DUF896 family)
MIIQLQNGKVIQTTGVDLMVKKLREMQKKGREIK